jgi:hypothetical protein
MVGWDMLVDLKLQTLKINIFPFGCLNIMFMGCFLQCPPINDCPLYFVNVTTNILVHITYPKKMIEKSLWDKYVNPHTIILIKQMMEVEDVQKTCYKTYITMLSQKMIILTNMF